jgi:hypothetical protein
MCDLCGRTGITSIRRNVCMASWSVVPRDVAAGFDPDWRLLHLRELLSPEGMVLAIQNAPP